MSSLVKKMLEGGVPQGCSIVISGPPGVGKTVFVTNVLGEQLRRGVRCMYVALERPIQGFLYQLESMGYPVGENKQSLIFVDAYSWRTGGSESKHSVRNLSNLNELSVKLFMALSEAGKGCFYVVDSLSNLTPYCAEKEVIHFFGVNSARLKTNLSSGIWVVEDGIHDPSFYNMLHHLADGVVEMGFASKGELTYRTIRTKTLRGMTNSMERFELIISDSGRVMLDKMDDEINTH